MGKFGERLSNAMGNVGKTLDTAIQLEGDNQKDIRQSKFATELEELRNIHENNRQGALFAHNQSSATIRSDHETGLAEKKEMADTTAREDEQKHEQDVKIPGQRDIANIYAESRALPDNTTQKDSQAAVTSAINGYNKALEADSLGDLDGTKLDDLRARLAQGVYARSRGDTDAVVRAYLGMGANGSEARRLAILVASRAAGPTATPPAAGAGPVPAPATSATPATATPPQPQPRGDTTTTSGNLRNQIDEKVPRPLEPQADAGASSGPTDAETGLSQKQQVSYDALLRTSMDMLAEARANPKSTFQQRIAKQGDLWAINRARKAVDLEPLSQGDYYKNKRIGQMKEQIATTGDGLKLG